MASKEKETPQMKVFTVGLDQKPPLEESKSPPSPPPGYVTPSPPASVIMGPEPPIIIRKSRGYKGVLIVLLSVFLIALFALTLSEIAYNRQRDENFFRLRWAELRHRMGWDHSWYGWGQDRAPVFNMHHAQEIQPQPLNQAIETQAPSTESPVIEKSEDPKKPVSIADRLQFFKQLLEGIKKQAESMGFDGTMQVSVVQVDPLNSADAQDITKSDSFLDGFGEVHQPEQPALKSDSSSGSEETPEFRIRRPCGFFNCENQNEEAPMQFPRFGAPFRPDWMRGPALFGDRNEENTAERFFPKVEVIDIPVSGEENNGNVYGRRFGRILQEIIANRLRNFQQMNQFPSRPDVSPNMQLQAPWWQPIRPQFPQSFPVGNGLDFNRPTNQQTPPPFIFFPNPQPQHFPRHRLDNRPGFVPEQQNFIPPEDRIQIEPPTQQFVDWKPWNSDNGNNFVNLNNEIARPENVPQQPENKAEPQVPVQNAQAPTQILDGATNEKKEDVPAPKEEKPVPILAIDPPQPGVDFPAVKFPMSDDVNNNNREHNPIFFQVDEPQQDQQVPIEK